MAPVPVVKIGQWLLFLLGMYGNGSCSCCDVRAMAPVPVVRVGQWLLFLL